jgi:hypothetical protein
LIVFIFANCTILLTEVVTTTFNQGIIVCANIQFHQYRVNRTTVAYNSFIHQIAISSLNSISTNQLFLSTEEALFSWSWHQVLQIAINAYSKHIHSSQPETIDTKNIK